MTKPTRTISNTPKNPEATKKQLLDAALKVFCNISFCGARLEDIAQEAGVTRGAISYHFQNKETIVSSLIKEIFNFDLYNLIPLYKSNDSPKEALKKIVQFLINEREEKYKEVVLYNNLQFSKFKERTELLEFVDERFRLLFEMHNDLLKKGVLEGCFKDNIDTKFETRFFYSFFWGLFTTQFRFFSSYSEEDLNAHLKENIITRLVI